ncbi:hypothetical protein [Micromonospora sp. NPDC005324]|uniref:hypothetical protein n=1 Tax=Micromonospora sp. NPDC005324 TaxID=3157033 RepID=UPI0033AF4F5F
MRDELLIWLLALPLSIGLGYVIHRERRYRWFRRWSHLLLMPPIANIASPAEPNADRPGCRDEWKPDALA